jgi:hypothetical protein
VPAWKRKLAGLAEATRLETTVCHYPPGTRSGTRIEHRMLSFVTMNWRGRPIESYRIIVELIGSTTTTRAFESRPPDLAAKRMRVV